MNKKNWGLEKEVKGKKGRGGERNILKSEKKTWEEKV